MPQSVVVSAEARAGLIQTFESIIQYVRDTFVQNPHARTTFLYENQQELRLIYPNHTE